MANTKDAEKASRAVQAVVKGYNKKRPPVSSAPPRPFVKGQTLADRREIAKGNKRMATMGAKNRGSYYDYDPLDSIMTKQTMKKKARQARKAK